MKKRTSLPMVGGSSLLVIFAVLCLCIFALLSLNTAQAGARLSRRSAEAVSAYYAAETQAEEILARLREGDIPDSVSFSGDICSYTCPISDTQELRVTVRLDNANSYELLQWQTVSTSPWQADDSIDVWDGNE